MAKKNIKKTVNSAEHAKEIIAKLKENPELLRNFLYLFEKEKLSEKEPLLLPDFIFTKEATLFESSVKYLKENLNLNYKKIADLVNRDQRNIWQAYNSAKRKLPSRFTDERPKITIPVYVLSDKKFSVMEAITAYLKEDLGLTYHEIAMLTHRDDSTIWTSYSRVKKKRAKNV